jgi:molybdopterin molybdotransferase
MSVLTAISVEEAICRVLLHAEPLKSQSVSLDFDIVGRVLAVDVCAAENHPSFEASIMDGYAIVAPHEAGVFTLKESIHAGTDASDMTLGPGEVTYITTGAIAERKEQNRKQAQQNKQSAA